jgi:hypothetical protein
MANENFLRDFAGSKKIGKKGEAVAKDLLDSHPFVESVEDLSEVLEYQWQDVDYRVTFKDGSVHLVEVKTDTYNKSNNILAETIANKEKARPGWLHSSAATILCYYFVNGSPRGADNLLFMDMEELRRVVRNHPELPDFTAKKENQVNGADGEMKTTQGKKVPRNLVRLRSSYNIPPLNILNPHSARADWKN